MKFIALLLIISFFNLSPVSAKVLQEGWFQILSGQQHVGYLVQRYEFLEKNKQFKFTSFMKTNALGGDVTESVTALSTDGFAPISYQYTTQVGKTVKLIDASFKGDNMTAKITTNSETQTTQSKIKKGTFLSYFLVYMILQNKEGLKSGVSFQYEAIAEEDAKAFTGYADVTEMEEIDGHQSFKVLTRFKDIRSISNITPIGEVIQTRQPVSGIQLKAATQAEATRGFPSSTKSIRALFKTIPADSHLAKPREAAKKEFTEPSGYPKGMTVPPGKDLPAKKGN